MGTSAEQLHDALEELRTELSTIGSPAAWNLRPGLKKHEIDSITGMLPFSLPAEVAALFMWRNGVDGDRTRGEREFVPEGDFCGLDELVRLYQAHAKNAVALASPELPASWFWDKTALPLFPTDLGLQASWVALCGETTPNGTPCGYWDMVDHCLTETYPSLTALVRDTAGRIRSGQLQHDPILGLVDVRPAPNPIVLARYPWPST